MLLPFFVQSAAHPSYKDRIVNARAEDTVHTKLYDMGWPPRPADPDPARARKRKAILPKIFVRKVRGTTPPSCITASASSGCRL